MVGDSLYTCGGGWWLGRRLSPTEAKVVVDTKPGRGLGRGLSALLPDADFPDTAELKLVPVEDISPNPQQPRRDFPPGELEGLAASVAEKGLIQPLVVRRTRTGYELIAGERRLRAARMAGLKEVPCRILDVTSDADMLELSLVENLQREDLNPMELAEGYRRLATAFQLTQEQIARRVGKDRATVANTMRLLDLPEPVQQSLRRGEITAGHAKALLGLPGAARQSAAWKRVVGEGLSVRQTEELVRGYAKRTPSAPRAEEKSLPRHLATLAERLRRALSTQVHIRPRGRGGVVQIEYYGEDDLARLVERITGGGEG